VTLIDLLAERGTTTRRKSGAILFHEGEPASSVYGLVGGRVRIEVNTPTGGRLVLAVKEAGDLVGELGALDGRPRSATAVAMEAVELVQLGVDGFLAALEAQPQHAVALLQRVSRDLRDSVDRTTARASADTTQRLAMLLTDLADRYGEHTGEVVEIDLSLTQDDVAGWIGATREATARSLRTLRDDGCVATARRRISVVDLAALRDAARG
jgi:CRP-like cAMP-binding protein